MRSFSSELDLAPEGPSRNKFTFDMVINEVKVIEPEEDSGDVLRARLHGVIFNFKGDILPWDVIAYNPKAIEYFEGLNISKSEPVYTQVWGSIQSTTIEVRKEVENAWGEPAVEYSKKTRREWVIEGSRPQLYDLTEEEAKELQDKIADRNVRLEEIKTNAIEYSKNQKGAKTQTPVTMAGPLSTVSDGGFDW